MIALLPRRLDRLFAGHALIPTIDLAQLSTVATEQWTQWTVVFKIPRAAPVQAFVEWRIAKEVCLLVREQKLTHSECTLCGDP
eukprot:Skav227339  [mRNA]  locus=scaffold624:123862:124665:- [translate_table: standard]